MENTTELISEDTVTKQKKVEYLRTYNRDYDHAYKEASECEHWKKTFSSNSALRRHQGTSSSASCNKRRKQYRSSERYRIYNRLYIAW